MGSRQRVVEPRATRLPPIQPSSYLSLGSEIRGQINMTLSLTDPFREQSPNRNLLNHGIHGTHGMEPKRGTLSLSVYSVSSVVIFPDRRRRTCGPPQHKFRGANDNARFSWPRRQPFSLEPCPTRSLNTTESPEHMESSQCAAPFPLPCILCVPWL